MSVSWRDVARKDFEDAVRSKLLWGLTLAFVGLLTFFLLVAYVTNPDDASTLEALVFVGQFSAFFVPLLALIAGYMAIVGERRSGSLRVLLSYPFGRGDVVVGKLVGRSVVVAATVLFGFAVVTVISLVLTGTFPVLEFLGIVGLTVALGATFTALAVGISAATSTRGKAMALAIGIFFVLFVLWDGLSVGLYYLVNGTRPGVEVEAWYLFVKQLNPMEAYRTTLSSIADSYVWPMIQLGLEDISYAEVSGEDLRTNARVEGELPFYLQPWFSVITFLGWALLPVTIGYRRFVSTDLE